MSTSETEMRVMGYLPVVLPTGVKRITIPDRIWVFHKRALAMESIGCVTTLHLGLSPGRELSADIVCQPMTDGEYEAIKKASMLAAGGVLQEDGTFEILEVSFVPKYVPKTEVKS